MEFSVSDLIWDFIFWFLIGGALGFSFAMWRFGPPWRPRKRNDGTYMHQWGYQIGKGKIDRKVPIKKI